MLTPDDFAGSHLTGADPSTLAGRRPPSGGGGGYNNSGGSCLLFMLLGAILAALKALGLIEQ